MCYFLVGSKRIFQGWTMWPLHSWLICSQDVITFGKSIWRPVRTSSGKLDHTGLSTRLREEAHKTACCNSCFGSATLACTKPNFSLHIVLHNKEDLFRVGVFLDSYSQYQKLIICNWDLLLRNKCWTPMVTMCPFLRNIFHCSNLLHSSILLSGRQPKKDQADCWQHFAHCHVSLLPGWRGLRGDKSIPFWPALLGSTAGICWILNQLCWHYLTTVGSIWVSLLHQHRRYSGTSG